MGFVEIFTPEGILLDVRGGSKREVVEQMIDHAAMNGVLPRRRRDEVVDSILGREKRGSTGLGGGVAIPHAKISGLRKPTALVGRSVEGVDLRAVDGEPVYVLVMLISPESHADEHLRSKGVSAV